MTRQQTGAQHNIDQNYHRSQPDFRNSNLEPWASITPASATITTITPLTITTSPAITLPRVPLFLPPHLPTHQQLSEYPTRTRLQFFCLHTLYIFHYTTTVCNHAISSLLLLYHANSSLPSLIVTPATTPSHHSYHYAIIPRHHSLLPSHLTIISAIK